MSVSGNFAAPDCMHVQQLSKVGVIPSEGVELFRGRIFVSTLTSRLAEACCNLIKGAALGLWHLEVSEDKEAEQQNCEDDEDVGATELLQGHQRQNMISFELWARFMYSVTVNS